MDFGKIYISQQYNAVQGSRKALLNYCQTLQPEHFVQDNSNFGRGSIRNLLVHIANIYELWMGNNALSKNLVYTQFTAIKNIADTVKLFDAIDGIIQEFINQFEASARIEVSIGGRAASVTMLDIFTHTITHEFHHKGQVLSMSRHLGYTPIDTDIIR